MPAYVVHRLDTGMSVKPREVEQELERIEGDVVAIVPNIIQFPFARVNYLLIVERPREDRASRAG